MTNILDRREIADLTAWIGQRPHKPLVIRGARQVGKSTLVREFARSVGLPLVTADLERNPELHEAFTVRDPRRILSTLTLLTGQTVVAGQHILFLDEIQTSPDALASLRYFFEEMPELHVVAAGSLMDLALADMQFSMPVGRIEYLHLGPMSFEDFVQAVGHPNLASHLRGVSLTDLNTAFPGPIHRKCLDLLRQFWVVGGLPEAISIYAATGGDEVRDFATASRIQQGIVATYRDDFSKYSHGPTRDRMQLVFDALPGMVGRKFKYVQVSRDHRAAELADALGRLCMARVAVRVIRTAANGVPLAAEINDRFFKCLFMDIGLMCAALHLDVLKFANRDMTLVNRGALAEQFVGQQLLHSGAPYEVPTLYYWAREARNASAEVDYVVTSDRHVVPIEIKAGATGSLRSLHRFLKEKRRDFALRFNSDEPSLLRDSKKLSDGPAVDYQLLSLPLYLAGQARRLMDEYLD